LSDLVHQQNKLKVAFDCFLIVPVAIYHPDPTRINGYLVMTEAMNAEPTLF
jgi:glutamine synthetase